MKDNRSPVIVELIYSLQWFLLAMSVVAAFAHWLLDDPFGLCVRALGTSVVYIALALIVRFVRVPLLRVLSFPVCFAACILPGRSPGEYVLLGVMGLVVILCGSLLFFRVRADSQLYNDMFIYAIVPAILAFITWRFEMDEATRWINVISAIYLPLGLIAWHINRLQNSLSIFRERPDQPVKNISKRMGNFILTFAMAVLLLSLLLPQANGNSILIDVIQYALGLFLSLFFAFMMIFPSCAEETQETMLMESTMMDEVSEGDNPFLSLISVLIITAIAIWLVISLIKAIRHLFSGLMQRQVYVKKTEGSKYDTVEKMERHRSERAERAEGKSNAAKIRKIYRRRVKEILGKENILKESLTPSDIVSLCRNKGKDITELTALYRKARYTNNCTDEDVETAKKL